MTKTKSQARLSTLILCLLTMVVQLNAQDLKPRDVKKMIKAGQLATISVLCGGEFIPNESFPIDVKLSFASGAEVLASQFDFLWDDVTVSVDGKTLNIKQGKLNQGRIAYDPGDGSRYYPAKSIVVTVIMLDKRSEKSLKPHFCNPKFAVRKTGANGKNGAKGRDGKRSGPVQSGSQGGNGENGPDLKVKVDEEVIEGKTFIVLVIGDEKFPVDPACEVIKVISQGGDGGEGGTGGDGVSGVGIGSEPTGGKGEPGGRGGRGGFGGKGGNILVYKNAYNKHTDRITFLSLGGSAGKGGPGGPGGYGPNGSGAKGEPGADGFNGIDGQIVIEK
jgi:hypothetical protein